MNAPRSRIAGMAERRIFKSYASLSAVPTDELQALVDLLRDPSGNPGPNHAGLVSPAVMAELARRNGAACRGRHRPDTPGR
jgi:hypothetical protein